MLIISLANSNGARYKIRLKIINFLSETDLNDNYVASYLTELER